MDELRLANDRRQGLPSSLCLPTSLLQPFILPLSIPNISRDSSDSLPRQPLLLSSGIPESMVKRLIQDAQADLYQPLRNISTRLHLVHATKRAD